VNDLPAYPPKADPPPRRPTGRLAPSPTGALHLGNARTFLWAWLSARARGGRVLLRIEDLDASRVKPGAVERTLEDLRWLGLDWDGEAVFQSRRTALYRAAFDRLPLYPCRCSKAELSAPHEGDAEPRYPGTCRGKEVDRPVSWRFPAPPEPVGFDDLGFGPQSIDVQATAGDFTVARGPDQPAYPLAVVVDDLDQGVTEVVRGDDLIPSTGRQVLLFRALGAQPPAYGHVPLVVGPDGARLAKRHGDFRVASFRERGVRPERLVGALAEWSGLGAGDALPRDLVARWDWKKVSKERVALSPGRLGALRA
jgi:glutamyl-tRNA synthetase